MIVLLLTIIMMFVGVLLMYLTDTNRKKYTNYQINKKLQQLNISKIC